MQPLRFAVAGKRGRQGVATHKLTKAGRQNQIWLPKPTCISDSHVRRADARRWVPCTGRFRIGAGDLDGRRHTASAAVVSWVMGYTSRMRVAVTRWVRASARRDTVQGQRRRGQQLSTVNCRLSTVNGQASTVKHQRSSIKCRQSAVDSRPSTIDHGPGGVPGERAPA